MKGLQAVCNQTVPGGKAVAAKRHQSGVAVLPIAVIDDFQRSAHGQEVQDVLDRRLQTHGLEDIPSERIKVPHNGKYYDIAASLRQLLERLGNKERFLALNLSMGDQISLEELGHKLNIPMNAGTLPSLPARREEILNAMYQWAHRNPGQPFSSLENKPVEAILETLRLLGQIANHHGVATFVPGDMPKPGRLNLFSLVKGVFSVGLLPHQSRCDNPFVQYRVDGRQTVTTPTGPKTIGPLVSYATAAALVDYLRKSSDQQN